MMWKGLPLLCGYRGLSKVVGEAGLRFISDHSSALNALLREFFQDSESFRRIDSTAELMPNRRSLSAVSRMPTHAETRSTAPADPTRGPFAGLPQFYFFRFRQGGNF